MLRQLIHCPPLRTSSSLLVHIHRARQQWLWELEQEAGWHPLLWSTSGLHHKLHRLTPGSKLGATTRGWTMRTDDKGHQWHRPPSRSLTLTPTLLVWELSLSHPCLLSFLFPEDGAGAGNGVPCKMAEYLLSVWLLGFRGWLEKKNQHFVVGTE